MFKNRGDCNKLHRDLASGQPCNVVSKVEADRIGTPRRAPKRRTTPPAANKKSATSNHFPLTPLFTSSTPAASPTVSTPSGQAATPTPAPVGSRFGLSTIGDYIPQPTQKTAAELQPEDNFDIGDKILVSPRRSISAYPEEAGSLINISSSTSDARMVDSITVTARQPIVFERQSSSAGTVIVPETPFTLPPALSEAGPSIHHYSSQRHDPAGPGEVAGPVQDNIEQHMANFEIQHLRRSRAQCAQELEESTGLVNRLQVRRQIQEADAIFNMNRLGQLEANRRAAREQAVEAEYERRATMFHLRLILALLVAVMLAYGCWCVYMSPELKYIMKRREEVLRS